MRWSLIGVLVLSSALAGCLTKTNDYYDAPKALDKMTPEELCAFYQHYRENPDLSQHAKDVANQQARAKGCPA